jgi:hypothetical protein
MTVPLIQLRKLKHNLKLRKDLRYKHFLPRDFYPTLLTSWVSPYLQALHKPPQVEDFQMLKPRLVRFQGLPTPRRIIYQAFKERWFSFRIHSQGQVQLREPIQERGQYKYLVIALDLSLFKGKGSAYKVLMLIALAEFFYKTYRNGRVLLHCFDLQGRTQIPLPQYHKRYGAFYLQGRSTTFQGLLSDLTSILKRLKANGGKVRHAVYPNFLLHNQL